MTETQTSALIGALKPILSRVRTNNSAIKLPDGSRWTSDPITRTNLTEHLTGGKPRGVCPIKQGEDTIRLALFDLDSHKGEVPWGGMTEVAGRLIDTLELCGYRPVTWRSSGGKGIHIFVIWDEPQDAYSARMALREILAMIGFKDGARGVQVGEIEVFPKQDEVAPGEFGNQFILPLAGASEPLDPVFGLMPMGREFASLIDWHPSEPVERRARPAIDRSVVEQGADPIAKVREALAAIPNAGRDAPDYFKWRDICYAVHEATGGADEGLGAFLDWSRQNPDKHDEKFAIERVWKYVKGADERTGGGITRGTLYAEAAGWGWSPGLTDINADGFDDVVVSEVAAVAIVDAAKTREQRVDVARKKLEAKRRWQDAIQGAQDEGELRGVICNEIRVDRELDLVDRDALAEALKARLGAFGSKVGIVACRKMLAPEKRVERVASSDPLHWSAEWVYVTDFDQFHKLGTEVFVSMQGFNAMFNRMLPPPAEGEFPLTAGRVALDQEQIPTVTRCAYMPNLSPLFTIDGVEYANLFRQSSLPATAARYTPEGLETIHRIERHMLMLAGSRQPVADMLLDWCAHNVQFPGRKIRWAPVIKGIEGDGKSFIGRMMRATLGTPNVRDVSSKVLSTDFNAWAHGSCVVVLEEIRLAGHNRHDILNALKPNITNDTVPIHSKGKDEVNVVNTVNYIAFTNFSDALPLNDTDRRYWVIFTPFETVAQFERALGMDSGDYFAALFDGIENRRGEIRKWLLEREIGADFSPNGRAPMTDEKRAMIAMSVSQEEDALATAIEQGGLGVGPNVLTVARLRALARSIDPEADVNQKTVQRLLQKMGWRNWPMRFKWREKEERLWFRPGFVEEEKAAFRAELDRTAEGVTQGNHEGLIF